MVVTVLLYFCTSICFFSRKLVEVTSTKDLQLLLLETSSASDMLLRSSRKCLHSSTRSHWCWWLRWLTGLHENLNLHFRVWSLFTFWQHFSEKMKSNQASSAREGRACSALATAWSTVATSFNTSSTWHTGKLWETPSLYESAAGLGVKLSSQIGTNLIHATIVCQKATATSESIGTGGLTGVHSTVCLVVLLS